MLRKEVYGDVIVIENDDHQYAVTDIEGVFIVPWGKYGWISDYCQGFARVATIRGSFQINPITNEKVMQKWGIIDTKGKEVLAPIYDKVWNYSGKGRNNTKVVLDGEVFFFHFESRLLLDHLPPQNTNSKDWNPIMEDSFASHYRQFSKETSV